MPPLATTPLLNQLLCTHAPVAISISGGKDSTPAAHATNTYLDQLGHSGPRILIHSDLGRVEWQQSLPFCEDLAHRLGLELVVVRREAGDLLERWQTRWDNNVARYAQLERVTLTLPWSTATMRFCTSELKTAIICRELARRFPGQCIVSVTGIRREESPKRDHAPVVAVQPELQRKRLQTSGYTWNPILEWAVDDVWSYHTEYDLPIHDAYRIYGSTRLSCTYCILASQHDLSAAATCVTNHSIFRELVDLEIRSTFSFQSHRWLGDTAPDLLDTPTRQRLQEAKERAALRMAAEARIPKHLMFRNNTAVIPTRTEAHLLVEVRATVASAVGITINYLDPDSIIARYTERTLKVCYNADTDTPATRKRKKQSTDAA